MKKKTFPWASMYRYFTAPLCDINCGSLCAPENNGIPVCCENEYHLPVLFSDELRWLRSKTNLWKKKPARTAAEKKEAAEIEVYITYAHCRGIDNCQRPFRSLTCRFFPFEPYIGKKGTFKGITWIYRSKDSCPLIKNKKLSINQAYIDQSITVWRKIFEYYPREFECYADESKKLRKKFKRKGRKIAIFKHSNDEIDR